MHRLLIDQIIAAVLSERAHVYHLSRPHTPPRIPLSSRAAQFCPSSPLPCFYLYDPIMAGKQAKVISEEHLQEALAYVEQHNTIRDDLLTNNGRRVCALASGITFV